MILTKGHISSGDIAAYPHLVDGHVSNAEFTVVVPIEPEEPVVQAITRHFATFDPVLGGHLKFVKPVVLAGDFEIEFSVVVDSANSGSLLSDDNNGSDFWLYVSSSGKVTCRLNNSIFFGSSAVVSDGKYHIVNISRNNGNLTIKVDNSSPITRVYTNPVTIEFVGYRGDYLPFNGFIPKLKIADKSDAEDITTTFPIDSSGDAIEYSDENTFGEELVINGDFNTNTNTDNWSANADATVVDGKLQLMTEESYRQASQNIPTEVGKFYHVTADTSQEAYIQVRDGNGVTIINNTSTGGEYFTATTDTTSIRCRTGVNVGEYTFDNVSVIELTGNALEYVNIVDYPEFEKVDSSWVEIDNPSNIIQIAEQSNG